MPQTVNLTESGFDLALEPAWKSSPLTIKGSVPSPALTQWHASLWASPLAADDEDEEPLAEADGTVASGIVTLAFAGDDMVLTLTADGARSDDFWLVISGASATQEDVVSRAGWLRVKASAHRPRAIDQAIAIVVTDDSAAIEIDAVTYTWEVSAVSGLLSVPEGTMEVANDTAFYNDGTTIWTWEVASVVPAPEEAVEGSVVVVDGSLVVMLSGVAYTWEGAAV